MKKYLLIISLLFLYNCASSFTGGNITSSGVAISDNNFRYIGSAKGSATTNRIGLFGGGLLTLRFDDGNVYTQAMANLKNQANLRDGKKKGLVNIAYDTKIDGVLIFWTQTVTVTADIVEFID